MIHVVLGTLPLSELPFLYNEPQMAERITVYAAEAAKVKPLLMWDDSLVKAAGLKLLQIRRWPSSSLYVFQIYFR